MVTMYILTFLAILGYALAAPQYEQGFDLVLVNGTPQDQIIYPSTTQLVVKPEPVDPTPTVDTDVTVTAKVTVTRADPDTATGTDPSLQQAEPTQEAATQEAATETASAPSEQYTKTTGAGWCGESTFVDQTSDASPLAEDCLRIATNIANGGRWDIDMFLHRQKRIVEYKTCALGAQGHPNTPGEIKAYIGFEDIIDIIHDSVERFGGGGKVGAKGVMECYDDKSRLRFIDWGIYHR